MYISQQDTMYIISPIHLSFYEFPVLYSLTTGVVDCWPCKSLLLNCNRSRSLNNNVCKNHVHERCPSLYHNIATFLPFQFQGVSDFQSEKVE